MVGVVKKRERDWRLRRKGEVVIQGGDACRGRQGEEKKWAHGYQQVGGGVGE